MRGHADEQFVQEGRKKENHHACEPAAEAAAHDRGINVPAHEMVDGFIPRAPVGPHARAVPPFRVEFSIRKPHDLRERVEHALEHREEAR